MFDNSRLGIRLATLIPERLELLVAQKCKSRDRLELWFTQHTYRLNQGAKHGFSVI